MCDSSRAGSELALGEASELGDAAGSPPALQATIQDSDSSRIVASILKPLEALQQYRNYVTPRDGADDAAHVSTLIGHA